MLISLFDRVVRRLASMDIGPADAGDKGTLGVNRVGGNLPRGKTADRPLDYGGHGCVHYGQGVHLRRQVVTYPIGIR